MKQTILITALLAAALSMTACSKKEVSNTTLEDARAQSLANGVTVAKAYIRENPRLAGMSVVGHSDDMQTAECPQGSGWVHNSAMRPSGALVDKHGNAEMEKIKIVCSTVSANIGCYREDDFKATKFADNADKCDAKLPFPLPKVVGKG